MFLVLIIIRVLVNLSDSSTNHSLKTLTVESPSMSILVSKIYVCSFSFRTTELLITCYRSFTRVKSMIFWTKKTLTSSRSCTTKATLLRNFLINPWKVCKFDYNNCLHYLKLNCVYIDRCLSIHYYLLSNGLIHFLTIQGAGRTFSDLKIFVKKSYPLKNFKKFFICFFFNPGILKREVRSVYGKKLNSSL